MTKVRKPFDLSQIPDHFVRFDVNGQGLTGTQQGYARTNIGAEGAVPVGSATQYYRGDKTWQTLNTAAVPESGNLYFTEARVRATLLTGYAVGTNTALAATDSILTALGKIQAQLNNKQTSGSYASASHTHLWADITDKPTTFTPSAHTHPASDIVSGTMATARLGSGTANNGVFLRGDSTWAQVAWSNLSGVPATFTPTSHTHDDRYYTETEINSMLTGYASSGHNHTLDSLSNTTITSNTAGEILKWSGTAWINNTLAEAGISAVGHTHDDRYYTESEIGNFFSGTTAIAGYNKSNWDTAFGWGNHAGLYASASHTHPYLPLSGGTMTGVITTPNGTHGIIIGDDSRLADRNQANTLFIEGNQNTDRGYINFSQTTGNVLGAINGGDLTWRGNTVYHSGNLSLAGYVPTSRTITINGTTLDLSANRSWTIATGGNGTVTSIATGTGISGGTITATGTISLDLSYTDSRYVRHNSGLNSSTGAFLVDGDAGSIGYTLFSNNNAGGTLPYTYGGVFTFQGDEDGRNFAFYKRTDTTGSGAFYVGLANISGVLTWREIWHSGNLPYPWRSVITNGDSNTMTDYYTTYLGTFQSANRPLNTNWVNVISHRYLDSTLIQQVGIIPGNRMALRYSSNTGTSWTSWAEVWTSQNLPNPLSQTSGTYTPVLKGSSVDPTYTATAVYGAWVRVGSLVFVTARLTLTSITGGSGYVTISLPSAALNGGENFDDDFSGSCSLASVTFPTNTSFLVPDGIGTSPVSICFRGSGSNNNSRPLLDISNLNSNSLFDINLVAQVI